MSKNSQNHYTWGVCSFKVHAMHAELCLQAEYCVEFCPTLQLVGKDWHPLQATKWKTETAKICNIWSG